MNKIIIAFCGIILLNWLIINKVYAFSPSDIPGLIVWYKPETLQLNNNDPVPSWSDSSGNGYTLQQGTPSQQPFYYSDYGINGIPTVRFEGGQELKINGNLCNSLSNGATLFVVSRILNDDSYNLVDTNPSSDTWWLYDGDGTAYLGVFRPDRVSRIAQTPNVGTHIFSLKSGANYSFYIDGVHQNTVDGNFSCGDIFAVGGISGSKTLIGDISEVMVYNSVLSDTDRTNVENYLNGKYIPIPTSTPTPMPTPTEPPLTFSPPDVSGLTAWYKPESLQHSNSDPVPSWTDSSGKGYTLQQSILSEQPVYLSSGINGLSTVRFNGGQELKINGNLCGDLSTQATLLVVARLLDSTNYSVIDTNPATDSYWRFNVFGLSYLGVFRQNRVSRFNGMPTSGSHIFTLKSGTHYSFYTDGVHQNTVDGNFSCGDIFAIGGVSGGKPLIGDISEIIVYNSSLSEIDRINVEKYLYRKYFNSSPILNQIAVSANPIQLGNEITASTTFSDSDTADVHTAIWNWGDGTPPETISVGPGAISRTHLYATAGVYEITVTVTDSAGHSDTEPYQYVSVYDPTPQGLFTAGSNFISPVGSGLSGVVRFGLSYKYLGGVPVENRQFTMKAPDFEFNATSLTSLVISNGKGTLTGMGTLNGSGIYDFLVTGLDEGNTIRIRIKQGPSVIYDTQPGAADIADPLTSVTGQVIVN